MKKSIRFIVLCCAVSWAIAGVAILLGLRATQKIAYTVFAAVYMLLPAICAVVLQLIHKEKPFRNLGVSFRFNRWFLIAGIVPFVYTFITLGINLLFPNISFSSTYEGFLSNLPAEQAELALRQLSRFPPFFFFILQVVAALGAGYSINAVFALGEELGWRGYLLKALKNKRLLPVSLLIGTVWGLWHFPLILIGHNYRQHPVAGVGMMIIFCILISPVMIYIVIKSKSIITAAIFHGINNAIGGITALYIVGGNDLINGLYGLAGFSTLLLVNILFYLFDKYITKENIFTKIIGEY